MATRTDSIAMQISAIISYCRKMELKPQEIPWSLIRRQSFRHYLAALLISLGVAINDSSYATTRWTLVDLGTLGGNYSAATSINDLGHVVGLSNILPNDNFHAFIYRKAKMVMVEPNMVKASSAADINDAGEFAGIYIALKNGGFRPFIFSQDQIIYLDYDGANATSINNASVVAGYASIGPNRETRAFVYRNGEMRILGTLGGSYSIANAINNKGQVVGHSTVNGINYAQAFFYDDGQMANLGTLGGLRSLANHINDRSQIVGSSETAFGQTHAFLFSDSSMRDLGTLGGSFSEAKGINNYGHIVGTSDTAKGKAHAFIYRQGKMIDLNLLAGIQDTGWVLVCANAINNSGQIVGYGVIEGTTRAFLLSPDQPIDD
jgi:probable HAF family extracellular repeat protein